MCFGFAAAATGLCVHECGGSGGDDERRELISPPNNNNNNTQTNKHKQCFATAKGAEGLCDHSHKPASHASS